MLNFFKTQPSADSGSGDATYTKDELLGVYRDLTYRECQDLFRFWALGRRLVEALPNFALSVGREFSFGDYTSSELVNRFIAVHNELETERKIKFTTMNARIYGMSALFVTTRTGSKPNKPLTADEAIPNNVVFNALDPLSMGANIKVDLDPLSPTFQEPTSIYIRGQEVHPKRIKVVNNELPLYLRFNQSSFSFTGQSIFQNATLLIRTFNRAMVALQRAATKAGSIVRTTKDVSHASGLSYSALSKNNEMIRCMENDGIAAISNGESLQLFDINNIKEVGEIVKVINEMFGMALNDTPAGILLDKNLSFGLNDGSEDMKSILMAIEHFRINMLKPLYDFADSYALQIAFNPSWLKDYIKRNKKQFKGKGEAEVFEILKQSYTFKFGELYPLTDIEKQEKNKRILENLLILRDLGVEKADLESLLNQSGIYSSDLTLKDDVFDLGTEDYKSDKPQDPEGIYRLFEKAKKKRYENDNNQA